MLAVAVPLVEQRQRGLEAGSVGFHRLLPLAMAVGREGNRRLCAPSMRQRLMADGLLNRETHDNE
jgi:hypothetical protein